jgi:hypothetical protein
MGAGTVFLLLILVIVGIGVAMAFSGVGASLWKRQTNPAPDEAQGRRPTHKVMDESGEVVDREYDDTRDRRAAGTE